jgi:hypothetical protein
LSIQRSSSPCSRAPTFAGRSVAGEAGHGNATAVLTGADDRATEDVAAGVPPLPEHPASALDSATAADTRPQATIVDLSLH